MRLVKPAKVEYEWLVLEELLDRLEIPKKLKVAKIKARIKYYEGEESAYPAAVDTSYIINSARGKALPHSRVSYAASLKSKGLLAKDVAKRMGFNEKTVYHPWKIAENTNLMKRLKRGEINLREAIDLAYVSKESSLARETVYKSTELESVEKREGVAKSVARLEKVKDYLELGMFEKGTARSVRTGCSLVTQGNVNENYYGWDRVLLKSLREPALIDRIAGLLPGWELPKITSQALSNGIGISADYFSEYMHQLRTFTFTKIIAESAEVTGNPSIRDERAIIKLASAMYKLLRPDGAYDEEVLELSMDLAVELRNRIRKKLHEMIPVEFPKEPLEWRLRG